MLTVVLPVDMKLMYEVQGHVGLVLYNLVLLFTLINKESLAVWLFVFLFFCCQCPRVSNTRPQVLTFERAEEKT